jgi:hypothetical protein
MTGIEFLVALTLGAGALALWIDVRFPGLAPDGLRGAIIRVGIALLAGQGLLPVIHLFMPALNPVARALVVTLAVGLPVLVYSFLSSIWIIRIAQSAFRR